MLYPLLFNPVFKSYIWGGRNLERFGKELPEGVVAESWELSAHADGLSTAANGSHAGRTIPELMDEWGDLLVGTAMPEWARRQFPLLVKLIDANDRLSVQVHPDDAYAAKHEQGSLGKHEMWLVLDAEPGAQLIMGTVPEMNRQRFAAAVAQGRVMECLQAVAAKKGDVFYIPAGCVHAIGAGIVILEIQQSSNTTYRLYDYERLDAQGHARALQIDRAMAVIDFTRGASCRRTGRRMAPIGDGGMREILVASPFFVVERISVDGSLRARTDGSRFFACSLLDGACGLVGGGTCLPLRTGHSVLLPASLGEYRFTGRCEAVLAYVPDDRMAYSRGMDESSLQAALDANLAGLR